MELVQEYLNYCTHEFLEVMGESSKKAKLELLVVELRDTTEIAVTIILASNNPEETFKVEKDKIDQYATYLINMYKSEKGLKFERFIRQNKKRRKKETKRKKKLKSVGVITPRFFYTSIFFTSISPPLLSTLIHFFSFNSVVGLSV